MNPRAYGTSVNAKDALISVKYAAINLKDAGIDALQLEDKLARGRKIAAHGVLRGGARLEDALAP